MLGRTCLILLCLAACSRSAPPAPAPAPPAPAPAQVAPPPPPLTPKSPPHAPMTQDELATTDGGIAINNLEGDVRSAERLLKDRGGEARVLVRLIEVLIARGEYEGRIADYDRAADLADRLVRTAPNEPVAYLTRARTRGLFHRFADAEADLQAAVKRGKLAETDPRLAAQRVSILRATGHIDEALSLAEAQAKAHPDIERLGILAGLKGDLGQTAEAEALSLRAQQSFPDTSPFPLVWLYFQAGLMWENEGRSARAQEFYAAAHERLPVYAQATAHLAAMTAATGGAEGLQKAIALLRPIVAASDDPEYGGQLAALLRQAGEGAEADRLEAQARRGYQALLGRHPQAFASHAVRFYLGTGKKEDAQAALQWARRNLQTAATPEAQALVIQATQAAQTPQAACEYAARAMEGPKVTTRLRVAAARAFSACGQQDRAAAELQKLQPTEK